MFVYKKYEINYLISPVPPKKVTINGYEHYLISYWGGLLINTRTGKTLKGWLNKEGYRRVALSNKGIVSQQYIQRLVAFAFVPNDDLINKNEVDHNDEIRDNNNAINLKWVTRNQNMHYVYNRNTKRFDTFPSREIKDEDLPF